MSEKNTFSDYYQKATKLKLEGRLDEALGHLEKALDMDMSDDRPKGLCYADMADIYNQQGESQKELKALLKVQKYNPGILKDDYLEELKEKVKSIGKENKESFVEHFHILNDSDYLVSKNFSEWSEGVKKWGRSNFGWIILASFLGFSSVFSFGGSKVLISFGIFLISLFLIFRWGNSFFVGGFKNEERRWGTLIGVSIAVIISWGLLGFQQTIYLIGFSGMEDYIAEEDKFKALLTLFLGVKALLIFMLSFSVMQYNRAKRLRIETDNRIAVADGWYVVKEDEKQLNVFAADISKTIFADTLVSKGKDGCESVKIVEIGNVGMKSGS